MKAVAACRIPNSRWHAMCLLVLLFGRSAPCSLAQPVAPADRPPDFVPRGVYLSWEKPAAIARARGLDHWEHVGNLFDRCVENHVNTLWVANLAETDFPRLILECEKRELKLITTLGAIEGVYTRGQTRQWTEVEDALFDGLIAKALALAGDSTALAGWLLADEPRPEELPFLENVRQKFRRADPNRFCLAVTQWQVNEYVPTRTRLPVICTDLYPFFGPNDPNGPHTDQASRHFFRSQVQHMMAAIGEKPIAAWIMGMCFVEIWGPYTIRDDGHVVGLPGSYLHWRCPTPAEMRWQVWESLRGGAKGVFIFQLSPIMHIQAGMEDLAPPEVTWQDVLLREPTDAGPGGLTTPQGGTTPQLRALGDAYARMAPHEPLILGWKPTPLPLAETEAPGRSGCFVTTADGRCFCVVVNDDLHQPRRIPIHFQVGTESVIDRVTGNPLSLTKHFDNGTAHGVVELDTGDGTLLEIVRSK